MKKAFMTTISLRTEDGWMEVENRWSDTCEQCGNQLFISPGMPVKIYCDVMHIAPNRMKAVAIQITKNQAFMLWQAMNSASREARGDEPHFSYEPTFGPLMRKLKEFGEVEEFINRVVKGK